MTGSLLLPVLFSTVGLHLSLEAEPRPATPFSVHLSAHGLGSVEVVLTALPATPERFVDPRGPPLERALRSPPLLTRAATLREGLARSYRELHDALSPEGRELARETFGLSRPLGQTLREQVGADSRLAAGAVRAAWRVDPAERGWNEFDLDVAPLEPGLYSLSARRGQDWSELRVVITDLSLLAVRDTSGLVVLATRSSTGEALSEIELFGRSQGREVSLGKTSSQGILALHGQGGVDSPFEGTELWGQHGDLLARVTLPPPPIRQPPETGSGALFVDRRHYAPGDTVHLWAIARDVRTGSSGERSLSIPDSNRANLALIDREGRTLWQRFSEANALGVVASDLELPLGLLPGDYTLAVAWGEQRRGVGLSLDSDVPAELSAKLRPLDRQAFVVSVADRLGQPSPQAWVHWSLFRLPSTVPLEEQDAPLGPLEFLAAGDGITDAAGTLEVRQAKAPSPQARLLVQADVEDAAGRSTHTQGELPLSSTNAISLRVRPERLLVRPGHPSSLSVEARGPDSSPVRVKLEASVRPVVEGPGGEPQKKEPVRHTLETDAHGQAVLTLPAFSPGYVEVNLAVEGQPASVQALVFVTELGGDIPTTPDNLMLVPEPIEHRRPHEGQRSPGEEQRLLIMTPFESGTVLLNTGPPTAPLIVAIHGYSGVAHLHPSLTGSGLYVSAAALRGSRLFQQWAQLAPPSRSAGMTVRGTFDHPPHTGQRAVLALQTEDGAGRPLPSEVLGRLTLDGDGSPPLADQVHAPYVPAAAFMSSQAWWALGAAPATSRAKQLTPYGPTRLGDSVSPASEAVSFVAQTGATGRGQQAVTLPSWLDSTPAGTGSAVLALRAVAGPDQLGETSHEVAWVSSPRLVLFAPPWGRPGDALDFSVELRGGEAPASLAVCGAEVSVNGKALAARCDTVRRTASGIARIGSSARSIDLAASLQASSAQRLGVQQELPVLQPVQPPRSSSDLARQLTRGLAQPEALGGSADLACAAVRALGAVLPGDSRLASAALARLGQQERPEGGFGPDQGELRRDLVALEGIEGLREWADPGLLDRTLARVKVLADHLDEDQRNALWLPDTPRTARTARRSKVHPPRGNSDVRVATAVELAHRPPVRHGRRTSLKSEAQSTLRRLLALMPAADVLDLAEIAAALQGLSESLPLEGALGRPPAVERHLSLVHREGWTEAMLAAGEEPPEPTLSPLGSAALRLGAEVAVTLSVEVSQGGWHCVRDPLPAGLGLVGLPSSAVREGALLLCGEPQDGRLTLGYTTRALHAGQFRVPAPVVGVADLGLVASSPTVIEVAP